MLTFTQACLCMGPYSKHFNDIHLNYFLGKPLPGSILTIASPQTPKPSSRAGRVWAKGHLALKARAFD